MNAQADEIFYDACGMPKLYRSGGAMDWLKGGNAPDWPTQTHPGAYSAGDSLAEYIRGER